MIIMHGAQQQVVVVNRCLHFVYHCLGFRDAFQRTRTTRTDRLSNPLSETTWLPHLTELHGTVD